MADLTPVEKRHLERMLEMEGGYVLDFSNRTFAEFILDVTGRNIDDARYANASGSKANRLRAFWATEPNHVVGTLLRSFLQYRQASSPALEASLEEACCRIIERLLQGSPVEDLAAIEPALDSRGFELIVKAVRSSIDQNQPEVGLDRLHTFVVKYVRALCERHGIVVDRGKALHALAGEYVKHLKRSGYIESDMTERILKSSIGVLEAFNWVRNDQTMAHDNPILNYDESLLIFNHIASSIRFISSLEARVAEAAAVSAAEPDDDAIPF